MFYLVGYLGLVLMEKTVSVDQVSLCSNGCNCFWLVGLINCYLLDTYKPKLKLNYFYRNTLTKSTGKLTVKSVITADRSTCRLSLIHTLKIARKREITFSIYFTVFSRESAEKGKINFPVHVRVI